MLRARIGHVFAAAAISALFTVPAPAADPPPDLGLVHPDAMGFVHVRLAELWANPELERIRGGFRKAGPKALAALDEQFVPKPSTVERVTAVFLPTDAAGPVKVVAVARFTTPFDRGVVRRTYAPNGREDTAGAKQVVLDGRAGVGLHFADDRTVAFADPETLVEYLTLAPKPDGALAEAVAAAAANPLTAAVNVGRLPLPPALADKLPGEFKPLLRARAATLTLALGVEATVAARVTFPTPADAAAAEKAVRAAAGMARTALAQPRGEAERELFGRGKPGPRPLDDLPGAVAALVALGGLAELEAVLADPPVRTDGSAVATAVTLPPWLTQYLGTAALSTGLLLPATQKVREAAAKATSVNNLKQIGLAVQNYHDTYLRFPEAAVTHRKSGNKPLLSWRVAVLPYLEQDDLYRKFKLDEPWDSDHNKKLVPLMPKVYLDPRAVAEPGKTYYKVFVGPGTPMQVDKRKCLNLGTITDGSSNTLLAVAGGEPVVWTKPDDIPFDPSQPPPDLSTPFRELLGVFCDGHVQVVPTADPKNLKGMVTANGGELVDLSQGQPGTGPAQWVPVGRAVLPKAPPPVLK